MSEGGTARQPRLNILFLTETFAIPGGTQRLVTDLADLFGEHHAVFLCSFDASDGPAPFGGHHRMLSLGVPRATGAFGKLVGYLRKAFRLNQIKRRHRIDVTISNLWPADFINALSSGPGRKISLGIVNVVGNRQNQRMLRHRRFVGWIYRRFHRVVAINDALMHELTELFGLSAERVSMVFPFVTPAPTDSTDAPSPFSTVRRRIAWFGRLHQMKNLEPLFPVLKRLTERIPDLQLVVIGEGPHHQKLVAAAASAGLTVSDGAGPSEATVTFVGFVPEPTTYLKGCDLFALTSRSEGFGLVVAEAMSAGLPVLASDCPTGGPHAILEGANAYRPGRTAAEETASGYLLPIPELNDVASLGAWESALERLLTDQDVRTEKAANARRRASAFAKASLQDQWLEIVSIR